MQLSIVDWIAYALVIVGALNWGLVSFSADWNVVNIIFGSIPLLEAAVYALVGLAGLWLIYDVYKISATPAR